MLARIVGRSLTRRRRRKLLTLAAVTLGIAASTAVATLKLDVGDKISRELRSMGANIVVTPAADSLPVSLGGVDLRPAGAGSYLAEADLPAIKKIFWTHSILAFAPFLDVPATVNGLRVSLTGTWFEHTLAAPGGENFVAGLKTLHSGWRLDGNWPAAGDAEGCVVGSRLARRLGLMPGQTFGVRSATPPEDSRQGAAGKSASAGNASATLVVRALVSTGGAEEDEILAPLEVVQRLAGLPGKVRRVEVSALTKPDDSLARLDPHHMSAAQYEKWSCSDYAGTIAFELQQALPGSEARQVFAVSASEGQVVRRVGLLMDLLAFSALLAAGLAVASMMLATVLERRPEIGLFKSLGATDARVASIFLAETTSVGLAGGLLGYFTGSLLAGRLAIHVFGSPIGMHWVLLPAAVALALGVALAGSALPLAQGLRIPASIAIRND
jgi:putative ABC transport system permease protein